MARERFLPTRDDGLTNQGPAFFATTDDPRIDREDVQLGDFWVVPASAGVVAPNIDGGKVYLLTADNFDPQFDPTYDDWEDIQSWTNLHDKPAVFAPEDHELDGNQHLGKMPVSRLSNHTPNERTHLQVAFLAATLNRKHVIFKGYTPPS